MWGHRKNGVFKNITSNPVSVIEQAVNTYHRTMHYNERTNMVLQNNNSGNLRLKWYNRTVQHRWIPPPQIGYGCCEKRCTHS